MQCSGVRKDITVLLHRTHVCTKKSKGSPGLLQGMSTKLPKYPRQRELLTRLLYAIPSDDERSFHYLANISQPHKGIQRKVCPLLKHTLSVLIRTH